MQEQGVNPTPITYGSIVTISHPNHANQMIYSDGLIETNISLQDVSEKSNTYRCLYQIFPSFINTIKKEVQEIPLEATEENFEKTINTIKRQNLDEIKEKLTLEYKFNLEHYQKVKDTPIAYDQPIQFLHIASNKFLTCFTKQAEQEENNYKLDLIDIPSEATNFKISPSYKHQKESEGIIYFGDPIYIEHASNILNTVPRIHCSFKETVENNKFEFPQFEFHNSVNFTGKLIKDQVQITAHKSAAEMKAQGEKSQDDQKEVNISIEQKTRWKLNLFSKSDNNDKFLAYGDVIRLNHAEKDATLVATIGGDVNVKQSTDELELNFIRQTGDNLYANNSGNTNGMWVVENMDQKVGGLVQWDQYFKLRHFTTGQYLSVQYKHDVKTVVMVPKVTKEDEIKFKFHFLPTAVIKQGPQYQKYVSKESFVQIENARNLWLHADNETSNLGVREESSNEDVFKVYRTSYDEVWETSFLISCVPLLKDYLTKLDFSPDQLSKALGYKKKRDIYLNNIENCINSMIKFCTNQILNTVPDQKFGQVNVFRQKVLREQYIIEYLKTILENSFTQAELEQKKENEEEKSTKTLSQSTSSGLSKFKAVGKQVATQFGKKPLKHEKSTANFYVEDNKNNHEIFARKKQICKLIYKLIINICKNNRTNEIHAYNQLRGVKYQLRYFPEAIECFISIISENELTLNEISEGLIDKQLSIDNLVNKGEDLKAVLDVCAKQKETKKINVLGNIDLQVTHAENRELFSFNRENQDSFLIYFLYLVYQNTVIKKRDRNHLKVLRELCYCGKKGVSSNQELLFQIFKRHSELQDHIMIPTTLDQGQEQLLLRVYPDQADGWVPLQEVNERQKDPVVFNHTIDYYNEQLKFYSSLLLGRNYLWKTKLEKIYSIKFTFGSIFNEKLTDDIRSVFCDLALTLHIDQEPLNTVTQPNMVRVFPSSSDKKMRLVKKDTSIIDKQKEFRVEEFEYLIDNIIYVIQNKKKTIKTCLDTMFKEPEKSKSVVIENFLDNSLLANLIVLLNTMLNFNLLEKLNKLQSLSDLVFDTMHLLEFNAAKPQISYFLAKQREENYDAKKNPQKNNIVLKLAENIGKNVTEFGKDIADTVQSQLIGSSQQRIDSSQISMVEEADEALFFSNPIMKGLILGKNKVDQHKNKDEKESEIHSSVIKEQICDLLNHMLDLRQDYLLSNVLAWYDQLIENLPRDQIIEEKIIKEAIKAEIVTILPPVQKTGVQEIDQKVDPDAKDNFNLLDKFKKKDEKLKFKKYTDQNEIGDLETLFTGQSGSIKKEILPSLLFTFFSTKNVDIEKKVLRVIMRMFSQRDELRNNLEQLEVIFNNDDIKFYSDLGEWVDEIRFLAQKSEVWLDDYIDNGEGNEVYRINELLDRIRIVFKKDKRKLEKNKQIMFRNLSGQTCIIGLIRDGLFHYKEVVSRSDVPQERKDILGKMFRLCFQTLQYFAEGNSDNQILLKEELKLFMSHLEIDIGQIKLVCAIINDNKAILASEGQQIIETLTKAINDHGRKTLFLEPLIVMQKINDMYFRQMQNKILAEFLPINKNITNKQVRVLYAEQRNGEIQFVWEKEKKLDEPYFYHDKLLQVFYMIGENLPLTHSSIRQILSLKQVFEMIQFADNLDAIQEKRRTNTQIFINRQRHNIEADNSFDSEATERTPTKPIREQRENIEVEPEIQATDISMESKISMIKPKLLNFLNMLYFSGDKSANQIYDQDSEFISFLALETMRFSSLPDFMHLQKAFTDYTFESLVPFIHNFYWKIVEDSDQNLLVKTQVPIQDFIKALTNRYQSLSRNITPHQKHMFKDLFLSIYNEEDPLHKNLMKEHFEEEQEEGERVENNAAQLLKQGDRQASMLSARTATKEYTSNQEYCWDTFKEFILEDSTMQSEINQEKHILSEALVNLEEMLSKEMKNHKTIIELTDIVPKLITFLRYGFVNNADTQTMITTLQILENIISMNPSTQSEMQNFFDKNGATRMLLSIFSTTKSQTIPEKLLNQLLIFGITLLEGGNPNVQKTIYSYCTLYSSSEEMFGRFYDIIYEQINFLNKKNKKFDDQQNGNVDDYVEVADIQFQNLKANIVENLLRFLQLFTEGHNLDLQNYLKHQTNSRNRYDLVEAVINLLRQYNSNLVESNFDNIIKCMDTLTEFVQGPCKENQVALIDGKFFEVAYELLSMDVNTHAKKQWEKNLQVEASGEDEKKNSKGKKRESEIEAKEKAGARRLNKRHSTAKNKIIDFEADKPMAPWMIVRLKYKVMILVLGVLEMRKDDDIIKRVIRALPLDILKDNMVQIYRDYEFFYSKSYTMECLGHFDGDPRKDDEEKPAGYYELIIETGFMIYFLITSYLEADIQDTDIDISDEIIEIQDNINQKNSLRGLLNKGVVGELSKFGLSVFKEGFSQLNKLKKASLKAIKQQKKKGETVNQEVIDENIRLLRETKHKQLITDSMQFFSKNSAHIEIVRNKDLEKIQFMVLPYCHQLTEEIKSDFNDKVDRASPKTKVAGLIDKSNKIIERCKHELALQIFFKKNKIFSFFANYKNLWRELAFLLCIVINIIILGSFSEYFAVPDEEGLDPRMDEPVFFQKNDTYTYRETKTTIRVLGIIMTVCAIFVMSFYFAKNAPMILGDIWKSDDQDETRGIATKKKKKGIIARLLTFFLKVLKTLYRMVVESPEILYYLAYGSLAVIGTALHPFFFAFHLTEVLIKYPTLKNVLKAVWQPRKQLGLTFLLYIILNYIFSLFAFNFLRSDFMGFCDSTLDCFLNVFDFTFKANGGVGGWLDENTTPQNTNYDAGRFFFDNLENILMVVIMINIVAGVIIDTFRSLREKEEEMKQDIQQKCFICGHSKDTIDRMTDSSYTFEIHIHKDHNPWKYVFYIAYLKDKDETEYTGIESYISDKVKNIDFSWFPFHRAMALKNDEQDEDERQKEMAHMLENEVDDIHKGLKNLHEVYNSLNTRLSRDQQ